MSSDTAAPKSLQELFDRQLALRVASGVALAAIGLSAAILGGWWAAVVVGFVTAAIHQEWTWLTEESRQPAVYYTAGLLLALGYVAAGLPQSGLAVAAIAIATAAVSSGSVFRPMGVAYAALFGLSILLIRYSADWGFASILLLFAAVWGTDIVAFFVGRAIGGPRLWPAISPNKTWSGAIGGLVGGVVAGIVVALSLGLPVSFGLVVFLVALSIAAEAGDLFESWVKRQMGEKDSGWLLPGHGGFMDRVDGLVVAASLALLVGWLRGGADAIGAGIVLW